MRIAFHAVNGVGLGHLTRAAALARAVREEAPDARVLVLTTARDTSLLERDGLDFVRLPPTPGEPHADPRRAETSLAPEESAALVLACLDAFAADLVVFDTHAPAGVLEELPRRGIRSALVLRELRPRETARFLTRSAWRFDRILIPHEPDEVPRELASARHLPIVVTGPVLRELTAPRGVRPSGRRVLVLAGGGGQPVDASRFLQAAADAHILARERVAGLTTTLVPGPFGPAVRESAGLTVVPGLADTVSLLSAADLVLSQAGYNTVAEIRAFGVPAILVPGRRKAEDQGTRARRLKSLGAARVVAPEARALADAMEELLLFPGRLDAMRAAHARRPLVARNREAARELVRPLAPRAGDVRRIVLVAHDFPPRVGGMETVAYELARSLAATGREVLVYTTKRLGTPRVPGVTVREIYRGLPGPRTIDLGRDLPLTLAWLLADAPDAVHLCHAGLSPWIPFLSACWPARVSVSVHGNDLLAPWVEPGIPSERYDEARRLGLREADAVLAVSGFSARLARSVAGDVPRVHVVPNGVDGERFRPGPADDDLRRRLGLSPGDEVVLTVSRLAPRKGHATALRAIARLAASRPRLRWVFTGDHPALLPELLAHATSLGLGERILPAGFVDQLELPALYRLARAFLLAPEDDPSDVEGFGVALLEASASGLPVVSTTSGGIGEAVEEGVTGLLVPPGDDASLAAALRRVLTDDDLSSRLGRAGRERARARFSWSRVAADVLSAWEAPAGNPAPPPRDPGSFLRAAELLLRSDPTLSSAGALDRHRRLRDVGSAAQLLAAARELADLERRTAAARRERMRRAAAHGTPLRLRATGAGAALLPEALDDAAATGLTPELEVKLRRFLEPTFRRHALPRASAIHLHHGVPAAGAERILRQIRDLPEADVAHVRSFRIHLVPGIEGDAAALAACVPEVHALRSLMASRGVAVLPPPELMRWLSLTPAGGPSTAMIEPTNRCNLACPTCPTGTGKIAPKPDMSVDRFGQALDGLGRQVRNLALWNYGEPTLHRQLPALIVEAKRRGVGVVKVSSNVHFLDGEKGARLLESGLDVLILSVDGASEETYTRFRQNGRFARVAKAVETLCAEKRRRGLTRPRIELQFIVMSHNAHEIPEIRLLAAAWGVDRLRIKSVGADDDANRTLVPAEAGLSRYAADGETPNVRHPFCTMAWDHAVVNVDGSVTPCCWLRPDMGDAFVMGNAFETPFVEIWRGPRYREFRRKMLEGREGMPVCGRCRGGTHDLVLSVEEVAT